MDQLDVTQVTVATTVDDRPPYPDEVVLLFASLERFGGAARRARRRAYCIGDVSARLERQLADLGVEVRVREPIRDGLRFANKLRMFDPRDNEDTALLVALDTDVVVAGDLSEYLDTTVVQARQVDSDRLTFALWERLFARFGVPLPHVRLPTNASAGWTHAYFNTGVVLVPGWLLADVHARWLHFVDAIVDHRDELADLAEQMGGDVPDYAEAATDEELRPLMFADQWAFALALEDLRAPFSPLPLAMNFPIAGDGGGYLRERFDPHAVTPLVLHHHHRLDDRLPPTGYREADRVIARVNAELRAETAAATAPSGQL